MKDAVLHHPSLARIQKDLHDLQLRRSNGKQKNSVTLDLGLAELLPRRDVADYLTQLYFDTFETTYRVLHAPTFWNEYQAFWENPKKGNLGFIAILLLVIATARCTSSKGPLNFVGESSSVRETAMIWIEACDSWVQRQSQKHWDLTIYQINRLLLLAKQSNGIKLKRAWISATTLFRNAMAAGLHRDPSLLDAKIFVFEQEMRRRLRVRIVEIDL